jgi:hypothetical protein
MAKNALELARMTSRTSSVVEAMKTKVFLKQGVFYQVTE